MYKRVLPLLALACLAPALLAPVRLKDSTPSFFTPPAESPAPESYSLPAADALTTPTIIMVSPTVLEASPSLPPSPTSLNLPLQPSPTAPVVQKVIIIQQAPVNAMPPMSSALCMKSMELVQNIAMLSYQQKNNAATMTLALAASTAAGEASGGQWPNLAAFNKADDKLPWFQPQKTEIHDAITAARRLCRQ